MQVYHSTEYYPLGARPRGTRLGGKLPLDSPWILLVSFSYLGAMGFQNWTPGAKHANYGLTRDDHKFVGL